MSLPQVRGAHRGPDAVTTRDERDALQRQFISNGWVLSAAPLFATTSSQPIAVANRVRLYYCPTPEDFTPAFARLAISVGAASSTVKTALYTYANQELRKLAGTEVTWSGASASTLEAKLPNAPRIKKGTPAFLAVWGSDALTELSGFAATSPINLSVAILRIAAGDLPASIQLADVTKDYNDPIFAVAYLSDFAARVL